MFLAGESDFILLPMSCDIISNNYFRKRCYKCMGTIRIFYLIYSEVYEFHLFLERMLERYKNETKNN